MQRNLILLIVLLLLVGYNMSLAEGDLDPLQQTRNLLTDPKQREQALDTPAAKEADRNAEVTALGKSEYKQEMYGISSDLMPWLVEMSKGDASKMSELIQEAQKNPQAFYERMPPEVRAKIKSLSQSIDSSKKASSHKQP